MKNVSDKSVKKIKTLLERSKIFFRKNIILRRVQAIIVAVE